MQEIHVSYLFFQPHRPVLKPEFDGPPFPRRLPGFDMQPDGEL